MLCHLVCKDSVVCQPQPTAAWRCALHPFAKEIAPSQIELFLSQVLQWPGSIPTCGYKDLALLPKRAQLWWATPIPELPVEWAETFVVVESGFPSYFCSVLLLTLMHVYPKGTSLANVLQEILHLRLHFPQNTMHTFSKNLSSNPSLIIYFECAISFLPR